MKKLKGLSQISDAGKKYYLIACAGIYGDDGLLYYEEPLLIEAYTAKQAIYFYEKKVGWRWCHDHCRYETMAYYWERLGGSCIHEYNYTKPTIDQIENDFETFCNKHTW